MSDGGDNHTKWIMEAGFVPKLVESVSRKNVEFAKPSLNIFSNLMKNPEYRVSSGMSVTLG